MHSSKPDPVVAYSEVFIAAYWLAFSPASCSSMLKAQAVHVSAARCTTEPLTGSLNVIVSTHSDVLTLCRH